LILFSQSINAIGNPYMYIGHGKILRSRVAMFVIVSYLGVIAACGVNIYSDADDVKLGQQLDKEIRSNPREYPILANKPEVKTYVSQIAQKVLASPEIKKRNVYPYSVEIIKNDSTINAFATPGGYIYVYTGLLKYLDNEAALAGVLAHEIGHAELRHATKRITAAYGVQILIAVALGENPGMLEQIAANLFTNLGFLKNSRDDEIEADNASVTYLQSTEYYPGAINDFFTRIMKDGNGGKTSGFETLFLTHPPSEERSKNVLNKMRERNIPPATEANLFSSRYRAFKKML
jgi:predicted Zn-dependent protease